MAVVSFDPVQGLMRLQSALDRNYGKPLYDFGLTGPSVFPPVNVFTDDQGLVVRAEVPGIKPDHISVMVEAGRLVISGERTPPGESEGSHHRRERQYGSFSRVIQLPNDLDTANAVAEVRHGVLTVRVPKAAAAKPRNIAVRVA